jgi:hypothetical protein
MDNQDLVFLKKLAAVCRKAGIKSFTGHGVQFELSDNIPTTSKSKPSKSNKKKVVLSTPDGDIETDAPTEEELLMWSVGGQAGDFLPKQEQ